MLAPLDAYCAALYPAESNHLMDIASPLQGDDYREEPLSPFMEMPL